MLNPPRTPLTWITVLKAATVADFDLLCDTRTDICSLPWTEPSRHEAMSYYFGIKRAHKEVIHLNIEITCLLTFMFDSHVDYYLAIQRYIIEDPPLAHSLSCQWQYQDHINESVVGKLIQASLLHGFTGTLSIGSHIGHDATLSADVLQPHWVFLIQSENVVGHHAGYKDGGKSEIAIDEDDIPCELNVDTDLVVQLVERLSTSVNV